MSAKSANIALENMTRKLQRVNLPRLAPATGFEGDQEFAEQVDLWTKWIAWEKDDPLVLKTDDVEAFRQRVLHCYKQALMALRFWPEMWVDAAAWCFEEGMIKDGKDIGADLLAQGISANPESVLLALKQADRIESTFLEGDDGKAAKAKAVRAPYDHVLETLYSMHQKLKDREKSEISKIEASEAVTPSIERNDADDEYGEVPNSSLAPTKEQKVNAVKQGFAVQTQLLSKTISFVWIALARAMRRIQGKGGPNGEGLRGVFTEARAKGKLTSDVYVAVALIESVVYRDPVGGKIFERGAKLFPEDENYMVEYLKYLHAKDDTTSKWITSLGWKVVIYMLIFLFN
jgi:cleavage stimulation factor subunit 3